MRFLALFLAFLMPFQAYGMVPETMAQDIGAEIQTRALSEHTDTAIRNLIYTAAWQLRLKGLNADADQLLTEFKDYDGFLAKHAPDGTFGALGDHKPLSDWLAAVCLVLLETLGETTFDALHLDDLVIINFAIPVVFHPHADTQWCKETLEKTCEVDYQMHFVPLAGVIAYWTSWGVCMGLTWGLGVALACTPIAMVCKKTMLLIAPPISDKVWEKRNP